SLATWHHGLDPSGQKEEGVCVCVCVCVCGCVCVCVCCCACVCVVWWVCCVGCWCVCVSSPVCLRSTMICVYHIYIQLHYGHISYPVMNELVFEFVCSSLY